MQIYYQALFIKQPYSLHMLFTSWTALLDKTNIKFFLNASVASFTLFILWNSNITLKWIYDIHNHKNVFSHRGQMNWYTVFLASYFHQLFLPMTLLNLTPEHKNHGLRSARYVTLRQSCYFSYFHQWACELDTPM